MYLGHHGFTLSYAVAKGGLLNVVAFRTTGSDTWDGEWFQEVKQEDYQREFEGWGHIVSTLISVGFLLEINQVSS